jgi:hypothetical protein
MIEITRSKVKVKLECRLLMNYFPSLKFYPFANICLHQRMKTPNGQENDLHEGIDNVMFCLDIAKVSREVIILIPYIAVSLI